MMNERETEINNLLFIIQKLLKESKLTLSIKPLLNKRYKNNPIHTLVIVDEITGKEYVITKEVKDDGKEK